MKQRLGALMAASMLGACHAAAPASHPPPAPPTSSAPAAARSALPLLLAVAVCPEVESRVLTLVTGGDGIVDAFALVKRCTARPGEGEVALGGDAWVWVGVDRDLGAARVRQFVHASVHAELTLGVHASYASDHLELTLTPKPGARASIEPVGVLEVSPLNWAGLLAVELAPAAGTSLEWVAKRRLRTETEASLAAAIGQPIVFAYDARHGESWVVGDAKTPRAGTDASGAAAVPRLRVVPRGTALLGPYPEGKAAPDVHLRIENGGRIAARAVCRSHAERLLENDRRGDVVDTLDWAIVTGDARPALSVPPCPWMLAMRALDEQGAIVATDIHPARGEAAAAERGHRWVALDTLDVVGVEAGAAPELPLDLRLIASTDVFRRSLVPAAKQKLPAIVELSADEDVWIRAVRPGREGEAPTVVGRARLPLHELRDVDAVVDVVDGEGEGTGKRIARVHVRARVREAPP
ncbi:MAG: hypothetical protein QOI41_153 [Myxococcales bacterium]|nr:hypothetical protein [Myxococcales bacterium]